MAFEVTCTHERLIINVQQAFWGSINDVTINYYCPLVDAIQKGLYEDIAIELIGSDGHLHVVNGVYLIVDGGYKKMKCLMDPSFIW